MRPGRVAASLAADVSESFDLVRKADINEGRMVNDTGCHH